MDPPLFLEKLQFFLEFFFFIKESKRLLAPLSSAVILFEGICQCGLFGSFSFPLQLEVVHDPALVLHEAFPICPPVQMPVSHIHKHSYNPQQ